MLTDMNEKHRVALAEYFMEQFDMGILHALHVIFTDEPQVWHKRSINTKNDIIWAMYINDIPRELLYNKCPRKPQCVGIFVAIAN